MPYAAPKSIALAAASLFIGLSQAQAQAQPCASNFKSAGVPMLTALTYRTWDLIPNRAPAAVLPALAKGVAADGFDSIQVDKSLGTISALQEVTGSGRPQTLRVTARASGKGTRVDIVFTVQPGQIAEENGTRAAMCKIISSARR
ncbi:hypothetical protein [Bosea sp. BIWAKO-01]|uniref:hypothetical protein n=1 Tax=Bosea sp. BIWAKO-01 TaxID=506668 RepID=UPI00086EA63E|nr:hypothetical protein [Bosea sp. BIWAKO-01]GAU83655.1 hypothetical protein BIWAKO_03582 [Bosea sp. BIWAKO-01]